MARIMAIDYGTKRTGIAVTDPLQIIANGLTTVPTGQLHDFLNKYFRDEEVECIVVGLPMRLDGSDTHVTQAVKTFFQKLQKDFPLKKAVLFDERFTSKIAMNAMIQGGLKKKDRQDKGMVDKVSATVLLQDYMQSKEHFK